MHSDTQQSSELAREAEPRRQDRGAALQKAARDHLVLHFTRMGEFSDRELPIIVRGDGCYVEDINGRRYLDALAGLFAVQIGYSYGAEIAEAAGRQLRELPFYTNWGYAHPRSIELAAEVASLTPGSLNRVFFVSGGSEAVESAWKLARQYHALRGETRWKVVSRDTAYHGTTLGALTLNGIPAVRSPFEPLVPGAIRVSNTDRYRRPSGESEESFTAMLLEEMSRSIEREDPSTVAMVLIEPVQNAGGCLMPPAGYLKGVRDICDRFGILLCADEVICGFGRLGTWFASERYGMEPDLITCAKGLSSGYASIGALIARDEIIEPFLHDTATFAHGITFGGHPVQCAMALKNIEILRRDAILESVRENEAGLASRLEGLTALDIVGDVRGAGYFYALELVKDSATATTFTEAEAETLLRGQLSPKLFERGLICRTDDRANPVVYVSPPLVAGPAEFDQLTGILGDVLEEVQANR